MPRSDPMSSIPGRSAPVAPVAHAAPASSAPAASPVPPASPSGAPDDGRHLDPRLAIADGEGAVIAVRAPDEAWPVARDITPHTAPAPADTYYDLPVVKPPPWRWFVPAYFHCGGLAGAAAVLGGAVALVAPDPALERRLRWMAVLGDAAGASLLVGDLGRPARFHHMLRVFRPTSAMNLGTWILSSAGAISALGLWRVLRGRRASAPVSAAGIASGALLASYTGVLLGNTAIPIWSATRRRLPIWFAALSAASLGSLLEIVAPGVAPARAFTPVAKAAQLIAAGSVARAAHAEGVATPLRTGRSSALWRGATWLGVASLAATLWPRARARPWLTGLAGVLGTTSALLSRFAIVEAGHASAADPRATFVPQRRTGAPPPRRS
ncbi:MAG TPA: hypothetical protein VFT22_19515 [Kofleriaceae bacterium]|nr:hypothetical protein [Kofleriaceae bacterium]